ncbi:hypothetical protein [Ligilactobacillus pobuzihii]|uniref:Uncharacterized protein n=1 Tax=Ligilactobacillus pobuzihii TaxID=449659 RepID=A0A0R2LI20_9LACO|nr:hypothetical protein [Ligilactobacillus pobuzihii]KRK09349.1 hypothetical protein FD11_GL000972 [Ligilactobacillus pobuzihii E100301 = KCTC 13174]KRN98519.1 hypothetical protein IV66_GL001850 [Ligilactobacillus pobuzihii]GEN48546.1 hypothetical protein LPO01_13380 [Ligilactobacillus pobuzihii]
MNTEDEAKQYLIDYFIQANKLNQTIAALNQLREQDQPDQEKLSKKVKEYGKILDKLNSGKEKMDNSLKDLGFDQSLANFSQEDLNKLAKILEP